MNEDQDGTGHRLIADSAGFSGRPRLTCVTCNATLVNQPWMGVGVWENKIQEFLGDHPGEIDIEED